MKINLQVPLSLFAFTLCASASACFGSDGDNDSPWRFSLGYRMGLNPRIKFENVAPPAAPNNPSVNGKSYTDGFVGTDSTGNALGLTTFWGYQNASQINGGQLGLKSAQSGSLSSGDNDFSHGFEFKVARRLGGGPSFDWGLETGFDYFSLSSRSSGAANGSTLSLDAFSLAGVGAPPTAPYTGPVNSGPGSPLLGTAATPMPIAVQTTMDASFYTLRLGPYLDFPLSESRKVFLHFSGGLLLSLGDSTFSYNEIIAAPFSAVGQSGSSRHTEVLAGAYLGGQIQVDLTSHWGLYTGVEWNHLGDFVQNTGDKRATVDLTDSIYWTAGVSWKF